jgi:hypothetical protein
LALRQGKSKSTPLDGPSDQREATSDARVARPRKRIPAHAPGAYAATLTECLSGPGDVAEGHRNRTVLSDREVGARWGARAQRGSVIASR